MPQLLNSKKKLIFINRYFYPDQSATSQLLSDLAFDLAQDQQVHVITSTQCYDNISMRLPAFENVNQVHIHRVWTTRFGRQRLLGRAIDYLSFYFSTAWQLWRLVVKNDIVIAKTDPPLISVVAAVIVKWRGAILVNWLQDLYPEIATALDIFGMRSGVGLKFITWIRNRSLHSAVINVVLGELMATHLTQQLGIESSKIAIIANWTDGDHVHPIAKTHNSLRISWGLSKQFVVGYSGNMGRAHEFTSLLKAAEILIDDKEIVFLFIGNGALRTWLNDEVSKRKLSNVMFQPYQERAQLCHSLTLPDLHIVSLRPSLEGFIVPSKFYGIAAAGKPTLYIGDKDGEIPRILHRYDCGVAVSEQDSNELAEQIKQLAMHPKRCQQLGNNARQIFERLYHKPVALKLWRNILLHYLK